MTRLLVATLFLALGACAGSIDEPGEGNDSAADGTDEPDDNTDETDNAGEPDADVPDPEGPTFANVYTILSGTCVGCHKVGSPIPTANDAINFEGDAAAVYATVQAEGVVVEGNANGSKLFNKPTESNGATHGGGKLFAGDSANGTTIAEWIDGGANE